MDDIQSEPKCSWVVESIRKKIKGCLGLCLSSPGGWYASKTSSEAFIFVYVQAMFIL